MIAVSLLDKSEQQSDVCERVQMVRDVLETADGVQRDLYRAAPQPQLPDTVQPDDLKPVDVGRGTPREVRPRPSGSKCLTKSMGTATWMCSRFWPMATRPHQSACYPGSTASST